MTLRDTADQIIRASLRAVQPDAAVQRALQDFSCAGRVVLFALGTAAWAIAAAPSARFRSLRPGIRCRMRPDSVPHRLRWS